MKITVKHSFCAIILLLSFSACLDLKHVNAYATSAVAGVKKSGEVAFSFKQHCLDRCRLDAIDSLKINRKVACACEVYDRADSVLRVLSKTIGGYFDGLARLSANDLTIYPIDPLNKSLREEDLEVFQLNKDEVEAYSNITEVLLHAFADPYRQKKIKEYIRAANPSLQIILQKFEFIESNNLGTLVKFKKERLFDRSRLLLRAEGINPYERQKIVAEYYRSLEELEGGEAQISAYARSLKAIARGHQKLVENLDKISDRDIRRSIISYADEIQDLIVEFNKVKKL